MAAPASVAARGPPMVGPIQPLGDTRASPGVQPSGRFFHSPRVAADD
jgi:hypothetical protein